VAALVLGQADPAQLSGRLSGRDFYDPAAGLIFDTVLAAPRTAGAPHELVTALPALLRAAGELRGDGYPIRPLLDWLPSVSVPAHPEAWSALVVASALGRQVDAAGVRLQQVACGYRDLPWGGAGRVLAVAAAQRATVHAAQMRWEELPSSWRHALPRSPQGLPAYRAPSREPVTGDELIVERELLAGVIAAPALLERLRWLHAGDFADPAHASLFATVEQLHAERRPVDLVTVAATVPQVHTGPRRTESHAPSTEVVLSVCRSLQPHRVFPGTVPWLARQQLEASLLREAEATGTRLSALAATPIEVGGLGGPVLRQAVRELDELGDHTRRLEAATRVAPCREDLQRPTARPELLPTLEHGSEPLLRLAPDLDSPRPDEVDLDDRDLGPSHGRSVS
jgi:hypothetical protein